MCWLIETKNTILLNRRQKSTSFLPAKKQFGFPIGARLNASCADLTWSNIYKKKQKKNSMNKTTNTTHFRKNAPVASNDMYRLSEFRRLGSWYVFMSYNGITGVDNNTWWWQNISLSAAGMLMERVSRLWKASHVFSHAESILVDGMLFFEWTAEMTFVWTRTALHYVLSFTSGCHRIHHRHWNGDFHLWIGLDQPGSEPPRTTKRWCLPLAGDVRERGGFMTS